MTERGRDFADIVYTLLVVDKLRTIEEVAERLGMSYAALHARLINRTCFSADEIRALVRAVPDIRLVEYLLNGTRYIAAERLSDEEADADSDPSGATLPSTVQRCATRVVIEATDILETVDGALAGGGLDHRSTRLVLREIREAEQALATLRLRIERRVGR